MWQSLIKAEGLRPHETHMARWHLNTENSIIFQHNSKYKFSLLRTSFKNVSKKIRLGRKMVFTLDFDGTLNVLFKN